MSHAAALAIFATLTAYTGWRLMCVGDDGWGLFGAVAAYVGAILLLVAALAAYH